MTTGKSRRARTRTLANRLVLALLVALAMIALYGLASILRPISVTSAAAARSAGPLPVNSALLGCPAPGTGGLLGGGIAQASTPTGGSGGQVSVTPVAPAGAPPAKKPLSVPSRPGQLVISSIPAAPSLSAKLAAMPTMAGGLVPTGLAQGGLMVSATGPAAQGLDVEQLSPAGVPTARCQQPGSNFWFVLPGSPATHIQLYLMNTDGQTADATVSVQTDSGPQLGTPDSGIAVPPHSMVIQDLSKMLRSGRAISLNVTTSVGRVVAAVRETTSSGRQGIWLPVAQPPATSQVIAGMPTTAGQRELYISVPGGNAAQVTVTAITPHGTYQPTGGSGVSLLGHLTTAIAIPSLTGIPGALKVTANVPVTAVLVVSGGPPGAPGIVLAGTPALAQQGVVAASPVGTAGHSELVLSAPGHPARVRIVTVTPGTPIAGQSGRVTTIGAKSSIEVPIAPPGKSKATLAAVIVTPLAGSGPVYAAQVAMSGSNVQSVLPVIPSPVSIRLPHVRESLLTVLG